MKKIIITIIAVLAMVISVNAADMKMESKIDSVTVALDKNGNEYVRMIVPETRSLNGIEYTTGVAVMAFGDTALQAKSLNEGDTLKAIVSKNEYQGRTSYTVIAWLTSDPS